VGYGLHSSHSSAQKREREEKNNSFFCFSKEEIHKLFLSFPFLLRGGGAEEERGKGREEPR